MSGDYRDGSPLTPRRALMPERGGAISEYAPAQAAPMIVRDPPPPNALREGMTTLLRYWKLIAASVLATLLMAPLILLLVPPMYEADALVQVEPGDKTPYKTLSDEIAGVTGPTAPVSAEIELLKSRLILGAVVDQMQLDVLAQPRLLPVIGPWLRAQPGLRAALSAVGLLPAGHGWGEERIEIESIQLPDALMGRVLTLRATEPGAYAVYDDQRILLTGMVGLPASRSLPEGMMQLQVRALVGEPGSLFDVARYSRADTIQGLLKRYRATEQGKDSGLIRVTFRGPDPQQIAQAVNVATQEYRAQDVLWRTAKASKTLDFLSSQLPAMKVKVENAEAALTRHKLNHNAPDLTTETALILQQSVTAEDNLQQLQIEREDLQQRFTDSHPSLLAINAQIRQAASKKSQIDRRIRTLPASQRELATLTRDLEVNMRLYVAMLDESQQLEVAKSGTMGVVRIVDDAVVPSLPVFPRPGIVMAAALIIGLVGGGFLASLLRAARNRVETVADLEEAAGPCCLAAIRHSPQQRKLQRGARKRGSRRLASVLALAHRKDPALDGVRRLRAALMTDRATAGGGVILVAGVAAGVGRSFVLANLAVALMSSTQRVVVVDADIEGRGMERYFRSPRAGVADWLANRQNQIDDVVEPGLDGEPDFIAASSFVGESFSAVPPLRLQELLRELRGRYAYVLVNAPPLSTFADSLVVAKAADAVVLVGRQFQHRATDVTDLANRLTRAGIPILGTVLNQVRSSDHLGYLVAAGRA